MPPNGLSNWRIAAFVSPSAALAAAGLPIALYVPAYYAGELGLGLALVGTIVMVTKLWDMATDPAVGLLTDHTTNRFGRRRTWLAAGAPILFVCGGLVYLPEQVLSGPMSGSYMLGSLVGLYVGFTLMTVSLTAWGGELSEKYHERSRIQGALSLASMVGTLTLLLVPTLIEFTSEELTLRERVEAMGIFMMILVPVTTALALAFVPERPVAPPPRIGLRKALQAFAGNADMVRLLVVDFLLALPAATRATVYVFFIQFVIQRPDWTSTLLIVYFVSTIASIPVWVRISRRLGKHRSVIVGLVAHALFALAYLLPGKGDILLFGSLQLITAFVFGGHSFLIRSMVADVTDADSLETGQQRTGLFYSLVTTTSKVGSALGVGVIYPLLALLGFDPKGDNDPAALDGLRYLYVAVPVVAELLAAAVLLRYSLDEPAQQRLRAALAEREAGAAPQGTGEGRRG